MPKIILSSLIELFIQWIEKILCRIKAIRFNPLWHSIFIIFSLTILAYQVRDKNWATILDANVLFVIAPILMLTAGQILIEIDIWHKYFKSYESSKISASRIVFESYITKIAVSGATGEFLTRSFLIDKIKAKNLLKIQFSHSFQQTIYTIAVSTIVVLISIKPDFFGLNSSHYYGILMFVIVSFLVIGVLMKIKGYIHTTWTLKLNYFGRVLIYFAQFAIAIWVFGPNENELLMLGGVALYFLLKTFIPVLNFLGGIGLREISLFGIFTFLQVDPAPILIASLIIWFCNHILPPTLLLLYKLFTKWNISISAH